MTHDIVELIKGFLFAPVETFGKVKSADIGEALKYFIVILLINIILSSIVSLIIASTVIAVVDQLVSGVGFALPFAAGLGIIVLAIIAFVLALVFIFIIGAWLHLWVYLLGGRGGYIQTMKAILYGSTPFMLIGWIPIIGLYIGAFWSLVVEILGIRELHEISLGRAVAAYLISFVILLIAAALIAAYFMIGSVTVSQVVPL